MSHRVRTTGASKGQYVFKLLRVFAQRFKTGSGYIQVRQPIEQPTNERIAGIRLLGEIAKNAYPVLHSGAVFRADSD